MKVEYNIYRRVNLSPYFKGFPMSLVIYFGVLVGAMILLSIVLFSVTSSFLVGGICLASTLTGAYYLFKKLSELKERGVNQIFLKIFHPNVKYINGGRPKIQKL